MNTRTREIQRLRGHSDEEVDDRFDEVNADNLDDIEINEGYPEDDRSDSHD